MEGADGGSGGSRRATFKWTARMEEAYESALEQVGGLAEAKPRAILELLVKEFPELTMQSVKWHLLAHRRREERHRAMQPAGIAPPTKWTGRLEEAYEEAVAAAGGLQAARPKQLLEALQDEFPDLSLQVIKCHLQKQRTREQRRQAAGATTRGELPSAQGTITVQGGGPGSAHQPGSSSSCGGGGGGAVAAAGAEGRPGEQQQQSAQQPLQPQAQQVQGSTPPPPPLQLHEQLEHQQALLLFQLQQGVQHSMLSKEQQALAAAALLAAQPGLAGPPPPLPCQHQSTNTLSVGSLLLQQMQLLPASQRQQWLWQQHPPWQPFLLKEAQERSVRASRITLQCRQVLLNIQQRAARLQQMVQQLELLLGSLAPSSSAPGLQPPVSVSHLPPHVHHAVQDLLRLPPTAAQRRSSSSGGSGGSGGSHGSPGVSMLGLHGATRQQRNAQEIASSFVVRPHMAAQQEGGPKEHDRATCIIPGCQVCAYEARLHKLRGEQAGAGAAAATAGGGSGGGGGGGGGTSGSGPSGPSGSSATRQPSNTRQVQQQVQQQAPSLAAAAEAAALPQPPPQPELQQAQQQQPGVGDLPSGSDILMELLPLGEPHNTSSMVAELLDLLQPQSSLPLSQSGAGAPPAL